MGKTLKVFSILSINCYIRWIYGRWYELDVVYKGGLYVHQMYVEKAHKTEKRVTKQFTDECAIKELTIAATVLIGNLKKERSFKQQATKVIKNLYTWPKTKKGSPDTQTQD